MELSRLKNLVDRLKIRLKLSEEQCQDLMDIQYCDSFNKSQSHQIISGSNLENYIGYIVMIKHQVIGTVGTFSCAYAIHKLDVKVGTNTVLRMRPAYFRWRKVGRVASFERETIKLDGADRDHIANYLEFKAMEAFQKKGMIPAINYVE